jgi:ketosteroid isomerase-like protein
MGEPWTLAAVQREDFIDMSFFDPEVTFEAMSLPDEVGETYRGRDGVRRAAEGYVEPFESMAIELEQIIDARDCLVSIQRVRAKARYTGIELDYAVAYLWTFRHGKVIHFRGYADTKQALKDAGLEE